MQKQKQMLKLKKGNKENKIKKPISRKKLLLGGIIMVAILAVISIGIYFLFQKFKVSMQNMEMNMGGNWSGNIVSASGVTSMGIVSLNFEVQDLTTELYIEEVYVSSNSEVEEGTPILKISDDAVIKAREELEAVLKEAELAYRAGVIEYEQSKLTAKYNYDVAVLEGTQAKEVYEASLSQLSQRVDSAQEALDEANEKIAEYQDAIANDTYAVTYPYVELKALYDENLQLLKSKMEEWGIDWSQVTGGRGGNQYETVLVNLYSVLEQNLKNYEQAKENYDNAVQDASLQLQKLQLNLSTLKTTLAEAQKNKEEQSINANLTYETTLAKADQAQRDYETALQKAEANYNQLVDDKEDAETNLALFEESVGDGYFYATSSGTILMTSYRAGGYLQSDSMVVAYSNKEEVTVTVSVNQTEIASINVGDSAVATVSNYGTYQGIVKKINPVSTSSSKTSVTYDVTILLEGDVSALSANQTTTVVFGMGGRQ